MSSETGSQGTASSASYIAYIIVFPGSLFSREFAGVTGLVSKAIFEIETRNSSKTHCAGTVTLPNRARNKSAGMLGSRRSDDVAPRLHRRGPEGSVRFCGGEMALDVESVVSGCVG